MKITVVGIHHIHQSILVNEKKLSLDNQVDKFVERFDKTLVGISEKLHALGLNTTLIANFSPHPKLMMALSRLEKIGVEVLPDLKDDIEYHLKVHTEECVINFTPSTKLELANFQYKRIQASRYVITNFDTFETLSFLSEWSNQNIIAYDVLPTYRALAFVQGIVLKQPPTNFEKSTKSLMQSGLNWLAIQDEGFIHFITLKHRLQLNFKDVDVFLAEFMKQNDDELVAWINQHLMR
ncbi:MAG TPA: hypothetical protein VFC75_00605 [Erysipelothrix sp.]|nr:hypothetical protein [Erysipelothrix sp.]